MSSRAGRRVSGKTKAVIVLLALMALAVYLVITAPSQTAAFLDHAATSIRTFLDQL